MHSERLEPDISIIAGCGRSIAFARAALCKILDTTHAQYKPRGAIISSWVDDLTQTMHGTKQQVVQVTVQCGLYLAQQLKVAGLKISPKTTVGASNWPRAKELASRLAAGGLTIQATQVA